jgi:ABC-type sugar transport system ATPase subunit
VRGIAVHQLSKHFGHVEALRGVTFKIEAGEIVALLGDNGAGKSTLAKTLSGHHQPSEGQILLNDRPVAFASVRDAQSAGVEMVYQDLALAPDLTVSENVFLGRELAASGIKRWLGMLDRARMEHESSDVLGKLAIQGVAPSMQVEDLSGGQRQAVAIARSILRTRAALLLDEPTAALGTRQSDLVCEAIQQVAAKDIAVLVISHDLERMLRIATRILVLHRGEIVMDQPADGLGVADIVTAMMGGRPRPREARRVGS